MNTDFGRLIVQAITGDSEDKKGYRHKTLHLKYNNRQRRKKSLRPNFHPTPSQVTVAVFGAFNGHQQ